MFKNGLLLNEEKLKSISGGKTASQEHNSAGIAADPFADTDATEDPNASGNPGGY